MNARAQRLARLTPVAAACLVLLSPSVDQAATVTWKGANGSFWDLATNWTPGLPGTADDAALGAFNTVFRTGTVGVKSFTGTGQLSITGGALRVTNASSTGSLTMTAGTLSGVGTVTTGTLNFTGGVMGESGQGGGTTIVNGATTFDGAGTQYIYYGRTLTLKGASTWTVGNGAIYASSGGQGTSTINIGAGTTFADAGATAANQTRYIGYGDGVTNNAGTYNRNGLGTTQAGTFNNTGVINVNAGSLNLAGGGSSTGKLNVVGAGTLGFNGGIFTLKGGTFTNAGTVQMNAGTLYIKSATAETGAGTFQMNGGAIAGPGTLTIASKFVFNGGSIGQSNQLPGVTTVTGATTINGVNTEYVQYGQTLNLNANTNWTAGNGSFYLYGGSQGTATLNLAAGTTFTDAGTATAGTRYLGYYGDGLVNVNGTYTRTGIGTTQTGVFNNNGTVNVNGGTLNMGNGGTSNGVFNVAAAGTLGFNGGSYWFNGGSIANNGALTFSGAYAHFLSPLTVTGTGSVNITSGYVRALANLTTTETLNMSGGSLGGGGTATFGGLNFSAGVMGENGWSGGTTTITGAATFDGTGNEYLYYGRTLNLNGATTTWTAGAGSIYIYSGSQGFTSVNASAANTFTDAGTATAAQIRYLGYYGDGQFKNAGIFNRTGLGTTQAGPFVNLGTVNVKGGTLNLGAGGSSTGKFTVAGGTVLGFNGGNYSLNGGSVANAGFTRVAGAQVYLSNGFVATGVGTIDVVSGGLRVLSNLTTTNALSMSGGTLSGPTDNTYASLKFGSGTLGDNGWGGGSTTILGAASFDGTQNQYIYYGHKLNLNGNTTWSAGPGSIYIYSGSQGTTRFNIGAGTTFADAGTTTNAQIRYLGYYSDGIVDNEGTYVRTGLGTTQTQRITNNGTIQVNGGAMTFANVGLQGSGTLQIGAAGSVAMQDGVTSNVGKLIHGGAAGTLSIGGGSIVVSNDYTNANWGVGNTFNRLANITFTGTGLHIVADGDVAQAIAAGNASATVTGGGSAAPTVTVGNVHVGGQAVGLAILNTGTAGPALRGALQSSVNGASITDARITNASKNWGPATAGASAPTSFTFTVNTAGVYAPIAAGQKLSVVNNFDNTNSQLLNIKSAAGAAAYNLAVAAPITPTTVALAAQRIGGTLGQAITVKNTVAAGTYSEKLDAAFGAVTGAGASNNGVVSLLAPGATNATALVARLDTTTAGAKTGTVAINFNSNGTGTSGLGLTALAAQTVNISGKVYAPAVVKLNTPTIDFGIVHKGDVVAAKGVSLTNSAAIVAGYNDTMTGGISGGAAPFSTSGTLAGIAAGATDATSLKVAFSTATTGTFSGTANLNLTSHDAALADLSLGTTSVALKGQVNALAAAAFVKS